MEAARSNTQGGTARIPGAWHVLGVPSCPEPPGARRGGVQEPSWGAAKGALCWPCRATHDGESLGEATDLDVHLALVGSVLGPGSRLSLGPGLGWSLGPVVRGKGNWLGFCGRGQWSVARGGKLWVCGRTLQVLPCRGGVWPSPPAGREWRVRMGLGEGGSRRSLSWSGSGSGSPPARSG